MSASTPLTSPSFLTVADIATEMRLTTKTVSQMLKRGEIPGKKIGNTWRVSPEEWSSYRARFSEAAIPQNVTAADFTARRRSA